MTDQVERVARAMIEPLGYPKGTDPASVWVGNITDSPETGSLAYLCNSLARAAIAAMQPQPVAGLREIELFDLARKHFHYAPRGTPDGAAFEQSETGGMLKSTITDILAALSPAAEPSEAMIDFGVTAYFHATGDPRDGVAAIYRAMVAARNEP